MTKLVKRSVLALLCVLAIVVFSFAGISLTGNTALAEEPSGFYMEEGAYVSTAETVGGIKWETKVSESWLSERENAKLDFGTLVIPKDKITSIEDLTFDNEDAVNIVAGDIRETGTGDLSYASAISYDNIVEAYKAINPNADETETLNRAYALELTARSYVIVNGEVVYADASDTTRSARQVAYLAMISGAINGSNEIVANRVLGYLGEVNYAENEEIVIDSVNLSDVKISYTGESSLIYIEGEQVKGTAKDGVLKLDAGQELPVGESTLAIVDENGVYGIAAIVATKVIKTANDLAIFISNVESTDNDKTFSGKTIDGYYVLGNNIDASNYVQPANGGYLTGLNCKDFEERLAKDSGFIGTFNGMGYSINNLTTTEHGVFGVINGGTVKNVAFYNVERVTEFSQAPVIACYSFGGTIENVYVSSSVGVQNGAIFNDTLNSTISNCVFEVDGNLSSDKAVYGSWSRNVYERTAPSTTFNNVYVISPKVLVHYNGGSDFELDAENRTDAFNTADNTAAGWANAKQFNLKGIYRYDTRAELVKEGVEFTEFDGKYWDITSGAPVFKSVVSKPETTTIEMFSAYDGDIDLVKAFGAEEGQEVVLTSATQNGTALTVEGSKIKGVQPSFLYEGDKMSDVDYVNVILNGTVNGEEKTVEVALKAYTRVIDEESDMLMFVDNVAVASGTIAVNGVPFDGYYILSRSLNMTAENTNENFYATNFTGTLNGRDMSKKIDGTTGLTGVFDGNGYTIDKMVAPKHGLFGVIVGGTVKNVSFTNVDLNTRAYSTTICAHMKNALIENVYIHTPKLRTATKNPYTAPLSCDMYSSTLTNVLIKVDADYTLKNNSFGSMTAMYGVYSSAAKFEEYSKFTNVVVISKDVLASYANNTDIYTVDAENCTATNKLVGVKRYTSVANAPNVTTTYWKIANGAITWGK